MSTVKPCRMFNQPVLDEFKEELPNTILFNPMRVKQKLANAVVSVLQKIQNI